MIPDFDSKSDLTGQKDKQKMDFINKWLSFFYPPRCQLCGNKQKLLHTGQICVACANDISVNQNACSRCAIPIVKSDIPSQLNICGKCTHTLPIYDYCWSPFLYAQPLEWMIQQLKFNAKLNLAPLLSSLITAEIPAHLRDKNKPDVIIPMPLHNNRLKQRGFNQAYLVVKPLAKSLGLPIDITSCVRLSDTEHQTGKNARQRKENIKNAFTFDNKNNYQHIVVFDDVVTTGSSVSELAKVMKRAGVKRVDVWCMARAEKTN